MVDVNEEAKEVATEETPIEEAKEEQISEQVGDFLGSGKTRWKGKRVRNAKRVRLLHLLQTNRGFGLFWIVVFV